MIKGCMETHRTLTYVRKNIIFKKKWTLVWAHHHFLFSGLSPEIVHFRVGNAGQLLQGPASSDWYIKEAKYVPITTLHSYFCFLPYCATEIYRDKEDDSYDARYMLRFIFNLHFKIIGELLNMRKWHLKGLKRSSLFLSLIA